MFVEVKELHRNPYFILVYVLAQLNLYMKAGEVLVVIFSLVEWLKHSKKRVCELCKHPFTFSPVYTQNMPERLPLTIFLKGIVKKILQAILKAIRIFLVLALWSFIPSSAGILFKVYLHWNWISGMVLEEEIVSTGKVNIVLLRFLEFLDGIVITLGVVVLGLGAFLFRDYVQTRNTMRQVQIRTDPPQNLPVDVSEISSEEESEDSLPGRQEEPLFEDDSSFADDISIASSRLSHISQNSRMQILAARRMQRIRQRLAREEMNDRFNGRENLISDTHDELLEHVSNRQPEILYTTPLSDDEPAETQQPPVIQTPNPPPAAPQTTNDPLNFLNILDAQGDGMTLEEFMGFKGSIVGFLGRAFLVWCALLFSLHILVFVPYFIGGRIAESLRDYNYPDYWYQSSTHIAFPKSIVLVINYLTMVARKLKVFLVIGLGYLGVGTIDYFILVC